MFETGKVIQNTYRIDSLLGEGGMGKTYKAQHISLNHTVAIKVISAELAGNAKALALFKREATLLRDITHSGASDAIVRIETLLSDPDGNHFLIMEYIDGKPLSHYINAGARLDSEDLERLARRLLSALDTLHSRGIIHRDISPDNIMVPDGDIERCKILDFGLASDTIGTEKSILGDDFAGKLTYASPEQLGLFGATVTNKSDLFSLGLVLLQLTGVKVPRVENLAEAIARRGQDVDVSEARVDNPARMLLSGLLKADPANRIVATPTYGLENTITAPSIQGKPEKTRRFPMIAAGVAFLAAMAVGGVFLSGQNGGDPDPSRGVQIASEAIARDDPLAASSALIETGGQENLNAALGALMQIEADTERAPDIRGQAANAIARMYDPDTFDAARSPFPGPNVNAALRFYRKAMQHGFSEAEAAIERLSSDG